MGEEGLPGAGQVGGMSRGVSEEAGRVGLCGCPGRERRSPSSQAGLKLGLDQVRGCSPGSWEGGHLGSPGGEAGGPGAPRY